MVTVEYPRAIVALQPLAEPVARAGRRHADGLRTVVNERLDEEIEGWARGLAPPGLERRIEWMREEEPMSSSCGFCVVHLFDHQAHHRGQVHAMLTAAGATPETTDLPVMP